MSLSINGNTAAYASKTAGQSSDASETRVHHAHRHAKQQQEQESDSLKISQAGLSFLASLARADATDGTSLGDSGADADSDETSGTYALTAAQKKDILTSLKSDIGTMRAAASAGQAPELPPELAAIQDELADYDASGATDDEISALFDEIAQTMESMRPPGPEHDAAGRPPMGDGMPPMMKAMGRTPPPPGLGQAEGAEQGESEEADSELTTDQKKELLARLQSGLSFIDSISSSDDDGTSVLAQSFGAIKSALSDYDASSADDDEIAAIFDEVKQAIEQART
ncbi:hypothetical protein ACFPPD_20325 [Cohnella suwonensis]|uniref:Uncharacterized protein n=1 Tax=Cohnella suwonensis TaxID=696072 RepID=A0ABW0LYZ1_9BACL